MRRPLIVILALVSFAPSCALLFKFDYRAAEAAAGGAGGTGPGPSNGSRVRVRYWLGDDGARVPVGQRDEQLGVDCAPLLGADGHVRCLPVPVVSWTNSYAEATCETRIVAASCIGALATVAEPTCPAGHRVWNVGASSMPAQVYVWSNGSCVAIANAGAPFAPLMGEAPLDTFVAGVTQ